MKQNEKIRVSLWIKKVSYDELCKLCNKDDKTISKIMRGFIEDGLSMKANIEDIDRITEIIRRQLEIVCEEPIERMIKVTVKNIKSSEASKQVLYSLLKEFSNQNTDEIIEKAEQQAGLYASNRMVQ